MALLLHDLDEFGLPLIPSEAAEFEPLQDSPQRSKAMRVEWSGSGGTLSAAGINRHVVDILSARTPYDADPFNFILGIGFDGGPERGEFEALTSGLKRQRELARELAADIRDRTSRGAFRQGSRLCAPSSRFAGRERCSNFRESTVNEPDDGALAIVFESYDVEPNIKLQRIT